MVCILWLCITQSAEKSKKRTKEAPSFMSGMFTCVSFTVPPSRAGKTEALECSAEV